MLSSARMSRTEVEARSGVNRVTLVRVERGDLTQVTAETASAILAVSPAPLACQRHGWVDGTGTRRRLQALAVLGWPAGALAVRLETSQSGVRRLMEDGHLCSASTRARVIALYDDLWDQQPAVSRESRIARRRALAHGWWPALAWDDDTIDDPAAAPSNPAAAPGSLWTQRVEDIAWMLVTGEVLATICGRLGVTRGALERQMRRHRRSDLWAQLTDTEADWHTRSQVAA
jgi:transcriptional regulator with XRE-family HTH domain